MFTKDKLIIMGLLSTLLFGCSSRETEYWQDTTQLLTQ